MQLKNEPGISICIPSYNGEKYLRECLDSCLNQTHPAKEILVVDDGSNDNTPEIVKAYQLRHSDIKFYQNEKNLGLVGNWNRCIELAQGEWIKFVFQDDYLELDCLEKFGNYLRKDIQLIVSKRSFILAETMNTQLKKYYEEEVRTLENTNAIIQNNYITASEISKLASENICLNFIAEPSLALFKKSVTKDIGKFNPDLAQICDLEFFQRLGSNFGLIYIPEKLCHFRIHASSTTSSNLDSKSYILSHLEPILLVHQMLYNRNYEAMRKALLRAQLFKLKTYLKVRTYEAFKESKKSVETLKSFTAVADKFVEIKKLTRADLGTKLTYLLVKLKRQFLN